MRPLILSRGLGACVLLAGAALAQNTGNNQALPVGQTFKQFTFPVYGPDGQLRYSFFATEATGVTLNRAETTDLRIEVYDNGVKTTTITSPKADLYVAEQKMRTKNSVQIVRADLEATSQDCDFEVKAKKFTLRTNVKVLLKHFDVGKGSAGAPKTAGAGAADNAAHPLPPGTTPTPIDNTPSPAGPTDESLLPSPAASTPGTSSDLHLDTNAAPLPPSSSPAK